MTRLRLTALLTVAAAVCAVRPAAAQDPLLIPRRQPIACPADRPYAYYQATVDSTHALVGWYCSATEPAGYIMTSLTATATELNKLASVVAGTSSASKALVLGTNKNTDILVLPVSGLKIGSGAGTAVTTSAAELNVNTGVTPGTATASKTAVLGTSKNLDILGLPVGGLKIGVSGAETAITTTGAELNVLHSVTAGTIAASSAVVVDANKSVDLLQAKESQSLGGTGVPGAAAVATRITKAIASIADATATDLVTVTVPNAAHSAVVHVRLVGSLGAGGAIGANECSSTLEGNVTIARTAGVATVATASSAGETSSSCVAGATTITLAYSVSTMTGAVGATQTFTIKGTITKGGGLSANHTALVVAEVDNANASGVTIQ